MLIHVDSFIYPFMHILAKCTSDEPVWKLEIRVHGYVHFTVVIYLIIVETVSAHGEKIFAIFVVNVTRTSKWLRNREVRGYTVIHYVFILNCFILSVDKCYPGDKSRLVKKQKNKHNNTLSFLVLISGKILYVRSHTMWWYIDLISSLSTDWSRTECAVP